MNPKSLKEFIENVRAYQKLEDTGDKTYHEVLCRRDIWDRLEEVNASQTRSIILRYLNQSKCRISYNCSLKLAKTLREYSNLFSHFKNHRLHTISVRSLRRDDESIQVIFRKISSISVGRRSFGSTATSKLLHLINPAFFMMYDRNIRRGYNCSDNEYGYTNFMLKMKQLADYLVKEYSTTYTVQIQRAFQDLISDCTSRAKTVPKLLDEYNWIKYNM